MCSIYIDRFAGFKKGDDQFDIPILRTWFLPGIKCGKCKECHASLFSKKPYPDAILRQMM
jgi:hypothetical protein